MSFSYGYGEDGRIGIGGQTMRYGGVDELLGIVTRVGIDFDWQQRCYGRVLEVWKTIFARLDGDHGNNSPLLESCEQRTSRVVEVEKMHHASNGWEAVPSVFKLQDSGFLRQTSV